MAEATLSHIFLCVLFAQASGCDDPRLGRILDAMFVTPHFRVVTIWGVKVRSGPGTEHPKTGALAWNTHLPYIRREGDWLEYQTGRWCTALPQYVRLTEE